MAASVLVVGCGGESRTLAENETCFGAPPSGGRVVANSELGMPSDEADLEAWVVREQGGLLQVTTQPCAQQPPTRMLTILPSARVASRRGEPVTLQDVKPGMKISVWYAGGAKGKARAVVVDRIESWPPGSEATSATGAANGTSAATGARAAATASAG
jgi:hypothetical protein